MRTPANGDGSNGYWGVRAQDSAGTDLMFYGHRKVVGSYEGFVVDPGFASTGSLFVNKANNFVGINRFDPTYRLDVAGTLRSSYSFRNYQISHSTTNTSGVGQTTTNITQTADMSYEYSYYIDAGTGGYPTCPYSYHVYCPIQKQNTG
jgi:hypothetical protein